MGKKILICIFLLIITMLEYAQADEYVRGYYRKDGTFVKPYIRTERDGYSENNYSTSGNYNPYTGEYGSKGEKYNYYIKQDKPKRVTPQARSYYYY